MADKVLTKTGSNPSDVAWKEISINSGSSGGNGVYIIDNYENTITSSLEPPQSMINDYYGAHGADKTAEQIQHCKELYAAILNGTEIRIKALVEQHQYDNYSRSNDICLSNNTNDTIDVMIGYFVVYLGEHYNDVTVTPALTIPENAKTDNSDMFIGYHIISIEMRRDQL